MNLLLVEGAVGCDMVGVGCFGIEIDIEIDFYSPAAGRFVRQF